MATHYPEPIRILSDVHLGHAACKVCDENSLAPLFRGARTIIFNGDTTELRFPELQEESLRHLERLKTVCRECGAEPVFVNGNHDPKLGPHNHLDLADGAILVTHGDLLYHEICPWSGEAPFLKHHHELALAELEDHEFSDFEERLRANKEASIAYEIRKHNIPQGRLARIATHIEALWPPWKPFEILRVWNDVPRLADGVAENFRPRARFVLVGHTHWNGVWKHGRRIVINTGGFLSILGGLIVEIANGRLSAHKIKPTRDEYSIGRKVAEHPITKLEPAAKKPL